MRGCVFAGPGQGLASLDEAVDPLRGALTVGAVGDGQRRRRPGCGEADIARALVDGMHVAVEDPGLGSALISAPRPAGSVPQRHAQAGVQRRSARAVAGPAVAGGAHPGLGFAGALLCWADQHLAVCDAIAAGDPQRARAASREHLASVVDNSAVATEHDPLLQRRIRAFMHTAQMPVYRKQRAGASQLADKSSLIDKCKTRKSTKLLFLLSRQDNHQRG